MGTDKALLPLPDNEQITFVQHLVALMTAVSGEVLLVARDTEQASHYTFPGVHILLDRTPNYGPLMGLYTGISAMQAERALVSAVDMPFIQPGLLSFLLSHPLSQDMLVPVVQQIPQVLLSVYSRSILPHIEARLQQGRRDPRGLLEVADVQYLTEEELRTVDPELRSFMNINTPEELRKAYPPRGER